MDFSSEIHIEDCEPDAPHLDVIYLDHDPVEAACAVADQHLGRALHAAAVLLSNAWWNEPALEVSYTGNNWLEPHPGSKGVLLDCLAVYAKGYKLRTRADMWVQAADSNYRWLWRHAMALATEYEYRFVHTRREFYVVAACEPVPPGLPSGPQTEPPVVREHTRVIVDEYVDAVASFRRYYAARRNQLSWTRRSIPPWHML